MRKPVFAHAQTVKMCRRAHFRHDRYCRSEEVINRGAVPKILILPMTTAEVGQPPSVDPVECGQKTKNPKGAILLYSSKTEWLVALA